MGWFVLEKYYTLTNESPAYAAAILLDPSKRKAYITKNWPKKWHSDTIESAKQLWETEYQQKRVPKPVQDLESQLTSLTSTDDGKKGQWVESFHSMIFDIEVEPPTLDDEDDFNTFISDNVVKLAKGETPLDWWLQRKHQYPRLSRMAIDILSIPPQSAEPERTFSGARRTMSWDRLSMTISTLNRVECIGNWMRNGHVLAIIEDESGETGTLHSDDVELD